MPVNQSNHLIARIIFVLVLIALILLFATTAENSYMQTRQSSPAQKAAAAKPDTEEPIYRNYKGVVIGMVADEARAKLGEPASKGDEQDFYLISDTETAQIFYDAKHLVMAISVSYTGTDAPSCKDVFGYKLEHKPDGSVHKVVEYKKAGYWVSYSSSGGDTPMVTISLKKLE